MRSTSDARMMETWASSYLIPLLVRGSDVFLLGLSSLSGLGIPVGGDVLLESGVLIKLVQIASGLRPLARPVEGSHVSLTESIYMR